MSPKLADEALVIRISETLRTMDRDAVEYFSRQTDTAIVSEAMREAARRELLRRALFGGKG